MRRKSGQFYQWAAILKCVCKVVAVADKLSYVATCGEFERPPETQAVYGRDGREKAVDIPHLRKCEIGQGVYPAIRDRHELVQAGAALVPLGGFCEALYPRSRWGGRSASRIAVPRIERDLGSWPSTAAAMGGSQVGPPPLLEAVDPAGDERAAATVQPASLTTSVGPTPSRDIIERHPAARLQALLVEVCRLDQDARAVSNDIDAVCLTELFVGGSDQLIPPAWVEANLRASARKLRSSGPIKISGCHWRSLVYPLIDVFVERVRRMRSTSFKLLGPFVAHVKDRSRRTLTELLCQRDWAEFACAHKDPSDHQDAYSEKLRDQYGCLVA